MSGYWQALAREAPGLVIAGPRPRSRFEDPFADAGITDPFALAERDIEIDPVPSVAVQSVPSPRALPEAGSGPGVMPESARPVAPPTPPSDPPPAAAPVALPPERPATPPPRPVEAAGPAPDGIVRPAPSTASPAPQPAMLAAPAAAARLPDEASSRPLTAAAPWPVAAALPPLPADATTPPLPETAQAAAPIPVMAQPPAPERPPAPPQPAPHIAEAEPREPALRIEIGEISIRIAADSGGVPAPAPRGAERGASVPVLGDWLAGSGGGRA